MVSSPVLASKPLSVQRRQQIEKSKAAKNQNSNNNNAAIGTSPTDAVDVLKNMVANFGILPDQGISSSRTRADQSKDAKRRAYKRRILNKQKKAAKSTTPPKESPIDGPVSSLSSSFDSTVSLEENNDNASKDDTSSISSGSDSESSQSNELPIPSPADQPVKIQESLETSKPTSPGKKERKQRVKKEKKAKTPLVVPPKSDTAHNPGFYQHSALRKLDLAPMSPTVVQQFEIKPIRQPIGPNGKDCGFSREYRRSRTVACLA